MSNIVNILVAITLIKTKNSKENTMGALFVFAMLWAVAPLLFLVDWGDEKCHDGGNSSNDWVL